VYKSKKSSNLMLFLEIIVFIVSHAKQVNKLCRKNAERLMIKGAVHITTTMFSKCEHVTKLVCATNE
jgi:hypothetical protein